MNIPSVTAFFARELRVAMLNRLILIFSFLALGAGLVSLFADVVGNSTETSGYLLLQASLYLIPLLSILIGTGSAQSETEEQPFLLSQPVPRASRVLGKFLALSCVVSIAALLLIAPAGLFGGRRETLTFLWLYSAGVGGVFVGLGLAVGFSTVDRVKAHMLALCVWLGFLAGGDLLALALAQTEVARLHPDAWLLLLILNPLDAFRISSLLTLDRIPFDPSSAPPLGQWWLQHLGLWFTILCFIWIGFALLWSVRKQVRSEI